MAVSVAPISQPDVGETDRARRFTSDEYLRMAETGILDEGGRTELIDGHILEMAPQNVPHRAAVGKTSKAFQNALVDSNHWVQTQSTLPLDCRNVPEPDVAVLEGTPDDLLDGEPDEIPIIVEVADTSLEKDRTTKLRCYATNGIPEYWIVNLRNETVEVYREPAEGEYRRRETMTRGEAVRSLFDDSVSFAVDALLPQHPSAEDE